jgi:S-adenosylmethionine:tRNA ribosyltransferase-isomerase
LQTDDFDYLLPPDRVAAAPAGQRDEARLLVMDSSTSVLRHCQFRDILEHLPERSILVLNNTRVIPARVVGKKPTGGSIEFLLTRRISGAPPDSPRAGARFAETWEGLARNLGGCERVTLDGGVEATVLERGEAGRVRVALAGEGPSLLAALDRIGRIPLPPYIEAARRRLGDAAPRVDDRDRYQTVYASAPGAVAAPTAGLHFTKPLLAAAAAAGHEVVYVTLDVGPGTFRPVETSDPAAHRMDSERYRVSPEAAATIARARREGRRVVAVGTTVVRTLEASARAHAGDVAAGEGETDLFLLPGADFLVVTDLITNFHLPRSTLLMLVAAFAGRERVLAAYREAIAAGYRFYSYGDAMFIRGRVQ